ncbi:DnaJ-like protein [Rhodotorula kratochvilovae]
MSAFIPAQPAAAGAQGAAAPAAAQGPAPGTDYDVGIGIDGVKPKDPSYYQLFGVKANCSDAELKKAYRKAAIRWHPDKNPDDPTAAAKFQEISEAYTILSDSNSRVVYDKHGKQSAMGEAGGEEVMPDPGALFSQMFGGKAFEDWIGEISLGKEVSKAFEQQAEEEEAEVTKVETDSKTASGAPTPQQSAIHTGPHVESTGHSTTTSAPTATTVPPPAAGGSSSTSFPAEKVSPPGSTASPEPASTAASAHGHTHAKSPLAGKPPKQTAEQKQRQYEEDRKSYEEKRKRVEMLAQKLRDRVRPFVEARNPGGEDDPETRRFAERMKEETHDLALESFGIELCHLLGEIYMQKATTYIRLHRKPSANLLGLPGWWARVKDKGAMLKEGWSFLSTGLDVQRAMIDMEKRQEKGDLGEDEMKRMEQELSGTLLLVAWKGSKFELSAVLRQVVDLALSKESPEVTDAVLMNRAKAILFIGVILKNVQPEEGDDERRELERLVAEANARRKEKKHAPKKDKKHGGADTPPVVAVEDKVEDAKKA